MTQLNRILFIVSIVLIFIYVFRLLGTELNKRKVYKCLDKELIEITKGLKLCESINLLKHNWKHKYEDNQTVISKTGLPKRYLDVTSKIDSAHMLFGKYVTHTVLFFGMIRVESDYISGELLLGSEENLVIDCEAIELKINDINVDFKREGKYRVEFGDSINLTYHKYMLDWENIKIDTITVTRKIIP